MRVREGVYEYFLVNSCLICREKIIYENAADTRILKLNSSVDVVLYTSNVDTPNAAYPSQIKQNYP